MISRREAVQYIVGGLGLAAAAQTINIGGRAPADSKVYDLNNAVLVPAGKNLGTNTIIPKTAANGVYFTPGAVMTANIWNTVSSQSVTFECWYLDPKGELKQVPNSGSGGLADMTSLTSARAANVQRITLPIEGGTIVSLTARVSSGTATYRGQTLVKVEIDNDANGGATSSTTQVLIYGYVYTRKDLSYPAIDSIQDPVSGQGYIHSIFVNTQSVSPASFIRYTIPTNARYRLLVAGFQYNTGSTGGTRVFLANATDPSGNIILASPPSPGFSTINSTPGYNLVAGYPSPIDAAFDSYNGVRANINSNGLTLLAAYLVNFLTLSGYQTGDTLQINSIQIEEWLDPSS